MLRGGAKILDHCQVHSPADVKVAVAVAAAAVYVLV